MQNFFLCNLAGAICVSSCIVSMMCIGCLAINRYVHICHHPLYRKIFSRKNTILLCILIWLYGIALDLTGVYIWRAGHYYDTKLLMCIWNRKSQHSFNFFISLTAIAIPSLFVFIFYLKIYLYTRKYLYKSVVSNYHRKSLRIAKGLFASFILFVICWSPYGLVVMIDFVDQFHRSIHMFAILLGHFNSSFNPIFYGKYSLDIDLQLKNHMKNNTRLIQTVNIWKN